MLVRADVLERLPAGGWRLIEVKSTTRLAETYNGDPNGATASPFGRLPGFTNQDPSRRQHDALAPFRRLTDVHPEYAHGLDTLPASARLQITTQAQEMRADEPSRDTRARDQDFAIACRLIEIGQNDAAITAVLQAVKNHANVHHDDYIERTIAAARQRVIMQGKPA